jgi:uncharacterized protein (DUF58 family)
VPSAQPSSSGSGVRSVSSSLSALTLRGRCFLAAGLTAVACALVLGQRDLLRVGVLLAAVPLGALVTTSQYRYRLALKRTIAPVRVVAGTTARVGLELENLTRIPTRVLLAEDRVPYALGPLRLRLADAFGMCEVTRSFTGVDRLVVVPKVYPLTGTDGSGQWSGTGESLTRNAAASGEDDVATREYRYGDDLRRVHWRSTARRGELMVRRDEQPRQMRATILLDTRTMGHRGDGPGSSFEWAVSAAASVAVHLAGQRYGVRLLTDDTTAGWTTASASDGAGAVLDDLAVVRLMGPGALADAVTTLTRTGGDGMVVAILGEGAEEEVEALAVLGRHGARCVAILLRTPEWSAGMAERRLDRLVRTREHNTEVLRAAGWWVAEAGSGDEIPDIWSRTAGAQPGARPRIMLLPQGGGR